MQDRCTPGKLLEKTYNGFVGDEGVPDASHGLPDGDVWVKLVPVEPGHQLGQEGGKLLPSLGCYDVEPKRGTLVEEAPVSQSSLAGLPTRNILLLSPVDGGRTFLEFHMAWWLARFMNLYTRSGWFRSLAREHSSLYVDRPWLRIKKHGPFHVRSCDMHRNLL